MKKTILFTILFAAHISFAQLGVGTISPNTSSVLDITSDTQGFLLPRITFMQKLAISSPATGLWVWCADCGPSGQMQVYNGTSWTNMVGGHALVPLLLNQLNNTPNAAYSTRLLSSTYSGNAIKVRRSSDNTESDIGFNTNGELNETALISFVGGGDGFVTVWYDQSGNANHVINNTIGTQPQIVFSGTVYKMNGKPAIKGSASQNTRLTTASSVTATINEYSVVGQSTSTSYPTFFQQAPGVSTIRFNPSGQIQALTYNDLTGMTSGSSLTSSSLSIFTADFSLGYIFANGNLVAGSGTPQIAQSNTNYYSLFNNPGNAQPLDGAMSELILFSTTVNRALLESNQGAYYSITIN